MSIQSKPSANTDRPDGPSGHESPSADIRSRPERYAATQAAANGIEGDVKKSNKTVDEKIAAETADMK